MTTEQLTDDAPAAPVTTEKDDQAPYGRRADGTPRGKPGPKRPGGGGPAGLRPGGPAGPPRRPAAKPTRARGTDYRPGINGLLQIAAFPLAIGGKKSPALALDAAAVTIHGPGVAEALNAIAQERPEVAAVLERILSVGPYGLLIGALIPLVAQVATNHGKLPAEVAQGMGALSRDDLLAQLQPPA